jgi:hypothetical protein
MVGIGDGDGRQRLRDGLLKGLVGARLGRAQGGLELRPAQLDGQPLKQIGGQVPQLCAGLFNGLANPCILKPTQLAYQWAAEGRLFNNKALRQQIQEMRMQEEEKA